MRGTVRVGSRGLATALLPLVVLLPALLLAGCDSPPQILDISPGRGAREVHTNQPVRIHFDRPLDRASVASRFSVRPQVPGHVEWEVEGETTIGPFEVSKAAWKTSGVFSGGGASFLVSVFFVSASDEHPLSARHAAALRASHNSLLIALSMAC